MILAVTTATPRFTAVLWRDGQVLAEVSHVDEMRHAERFFDQLDALLKDAGAELGDVTAIACDVGPGSFTGVRVGLASAKGIALTAAVPLVPVTSLEAMAAAAQAQRPGPSVIAVLDAKRGEVFYGGYDATGAETLTPGFAKADDVAAAIASEDALYCGLAGADHVPADRFIAHASCERPHAAWVARLAAARLDDPKSSLADIEPAYLRGPDAKKPTQPPKLFRKA